jgi:hypothetical protein
MNYAPASRNLLDLCPVAYVVPESLTEIEFGLWQPLYELESKLLLLFTIVILID